ncbi:MAG: DEAD/DEAH box helicase [Burkholderiaceae bacterium]
MPADQWQRGLRRQFGREQAFGLTNLGDEPFLSDFRVDNPASKSSYRVAIRGLSPGDNFCACPDFATNDLGTCKHIEFVLAKLRKKRGAKQAFARGWQAPFSEIWLRYGAQRSVCFRPGHDCPSALSRLAERLLVDGELPAEHFDEIETLLAAAADAGHELRAYDDALAFIASHRDAVHRARVLDETYRKGAEDPRLARLLKVPLYRYQAEGALFAVRAGRALIGDEMGLGKTIQAIAAMELFARHFGVSRVLIVCPASLKYQWQSEIARFSGGSARVIGGGRAARQAAFAESDGCKITNYEKLQPDLDLIADWAPELVIVDEAQRVKNWNTIAARALRRIDSPYAIVLTGTPLENRLEELIAIVQFVDQHRLGPTWKLLHEHQVRNETGRVTGYRDLDRIGQTLAPVMIRRRKAEVALQLPSRTDQNLLVPMTAAQWRHHDENAEIVGRIVKRWLQTKFLSERDQRLLTCALQNMRMSCNSTWLLDHETDHGVKADELIALIDGMLDDPSAKAVVFSQWNGTHDIIVRRLEARGIGHVRFHGGVRSEDRPALIERFHGDPDCRLFLSTDAGAAGLNLQVASLLVNMDQPWNPAILEQRIGRIHRMGQRRPVRIVNLIAKGTIEEEMLSTLAFKRSLAGGILDAGASEISLGGSRLNRFMKDVERVTAGSRDADAMATRDDAAQEENAVSDVPVGKASARTSMGEPMPKDRAHEDEPRTEATNHPAAHDPASDDDGAIDGRHARPSPWDALLQAGLSLATALREDDQGAAPAHDWIERDPATGARRLVIPVPPAETVQRLADTLGDIAKALSGRSARS